MEKLFVNATLLNEEIYREFRRFHSRRSKVIKGLWLVYSSLLVLVVLSVIQDEGSLLNRMRHFFPLLVFMLLLFPGIWKSRRLSPEYFLKMYEGTAFPMYREYSFYEDFFTVSGNRTLIQEKYKNLSKIYETDKYFYFYRHKIFAYIISKEGFTEGVQNRLVFL